MANGEVKVSNKGLFDENGKLILHNNITQPENKTYKIRGLQVVKEYLEKWGILISETCDENKVNLNINANTETKNQAKNIEIISDMAKIANKKMPVYGKDRLFALFLDVYPEFLRQKATDDFKRWINSPGIKKDIDGLLSIPGIEGLFCMDGIDEKTDKHIEEYVSGIIKSL